MKHIKLFEEVSSALPSGHTAQSISRMSVDDLDKAVLSTKKYRGLPGDACVRMHA